MARLCPAFTSLGLGVLLAVFAVGCGQPDDIEVSADEIRGRHGAGTSESDDGVLATRALINRDDTADLEVTTGALDSTMPAPGRLDRVDLQVFETGGSLVTERTFTPGDGDGYFGSRLFGMRRGFPFRIDALLQRSDRDPVTRVAVQSIARLRPDLSFADIIGPGRIGIIGPGRWGIIGPGRIFADRPVFITSLVRELNRDVGAVADCVLTLDGVEVRRINAFGIRAGGYSMCTFNHRFTELGVHQIGVVLTNVKPGDWDHANNQVVETVTIIGPGRGR